MDKLLEIINVVLSNREKQPIGSLSGDLHLRNDIGMDSLDLAELTVRIEAEFDVDIFSDGLVFTIDEVLTIINAAE